MATIPREKGRFTTKPGVKPKRDTSGLNQERKLSDQDYLESVGSFFTELGGELRNARSMKTQSIQYQTNAFLSNADKNEALRVGRNNAQLANVQRAVLKGEQKGEMAASGFVVGAGDFGKMIEASENEYYKTMSAIVAESEFKASGFEFAGDKAKIQADYLRKVAKITRRNAPFKAAISAGITAAKAYAGGQA